MDDKSTIDPMGSSYSLAKPASTADAKLPEADMERVLPRQQSTGLARGIQQLGSPNIYVDSGNEQIIVQKDVPRVLMGNQTTFGEGLYVTKEGIDATTAKNNSDFIFNSNQNVFKIVKKGTTSFTVGSITTANQSIAHNLGYVPIPMVFAGGTSLGGVLALPAPLAYAFSTPAIQFETFAYFSVDATNLYISIANGQNTGTIGPFVFTYYLLQETAN